MQAGTLEPEVAFLNASLVRLLFFLYTYYIPFLVFPVNFISLSFLSYTWFDFSNFT